LTSRATSGAYTRAVTFAWDDAKAAGNLRKHGIDFRKAATVFGDALSTTFPDVDHSSANGGSSR